MSRPVPLARRTITAGIAGALVVAVVALVLTVPLVRGVARDQSRAELIRAVEAIGSSPGLGARLAVREEFAVSPDDRRYGLIAPGGRRVGDAFAFVTEEDLAALRANGTLSTEHRIGGELYLIEGRSTGAAATTLIAAQPVGNVGAVTGALARRVALALALGLAAGAALALVLARRAAAPVREAAARAHRLAGGERGLDPPPASGLAEIDEMSRALTALDQALASSEGRQREFLLSISHELRTPLTAVQGYAEALRDGAISGSEAADAGRVLARETARLDRFIADLLALARLEADDFRLESVPLDLAELARDTATAWQPTAEAAAVRVSPDAPAALQATGDPMRLRQLLDGLVENAVRACPAGGAVVVSARAEPGTLVLSVADDGPGLEPGEHERAFERGFLRDRHARDRPVGTGLGLSIARGLATRMRGMIEASPNQSGGTTVTVRLPADTPPRRADRSLADPQPARPYHRGV